MGFLRVLKFQARSCSLGSKQILGKISQMIFQMVPLAAAPLNLFWVSKENQIESRLISIEPSLILRSLLGLKGNQLKLKVDWYQLKTDI